MAFFLQLTSILSRFRYFRRKKIIKLWAKFRYLNFTPLWRLRWLLRTLGSQAFGMGASFEASFSSIPATYINLDKRRDRSTAVEAEFDRMGLPAPERFAAIEDENAMLGAARSHLAVLESFRQSSPSSLVMVCEDDIVFLESRAELDGALREFTQDSRLDVLCIAFMLKNTTRDIVPAQIRASKRLQVANHILTQACYVLKPSAVEPVIRSLRQSVRLLSLGVPWSFAAGDVYWQTLQQGRLFFAIPANRLARQSAGYSNIWGVQKDLNY